MRKAAIAQRPFLGVGQVAEAMDASERVQPLGCVVLGANEHRSCNRRRELLRKTSDRPVINRDPEPRRRDAELARRRGDTEIGSNHQLRASTECRAVDRCDHRHWERTESSKHGLQVRGELALFDAVQVGTRTEGRRCPGQDHCSRFAWSARRDLCLYSEEFKQCWMIDGIAPFGPVERDDRDSTVTLHVYGHRCARFGGVGMNWYRPTRSMVGLYVEY